MIAPLPFRAGFPAPRSERRAYRATRAARAASWQALDLVGIKEYVSFMVTYSELRGDRERCLALTSLTPAEFDFLLPAFVRAYQRRSPADRTAAGRPRQRSPGGGRTGVLQAPEQKLLFLLVYLKTYPLQALLAEVFGLSRPQVNYWLRRLLPI